MRRIQVEQLRYDRFVFNSPTAPGLEFDKKFEGIIPANSHLFEEPTERDWKELSDFLIQNPHIVVLWLAGIFLFLFFTQFILIFAHMFDSVSFCSFSHGLTHKSQGIEYR
jgi:hypothetical protein